jgi:hypothetical protein
VSSSIGRSVVLLASAFLLTATYLSAQTVIVGVPFQVSGLHDDMNQSGFRLYIDDVLKYEINKDSLCAGFWTIGPDGEALKDGVHIGGGYGVEYRCVTGLVWIRSSDNRWWEWTGLAWVERFTTPTLTTVTVPGQIDSVGTHSLVMATFSRKPTQPMGEVKSNPLVVTAAAKPSSDLGLKPPINLQLPGSPSPPVPPTPYSNQPPILIKAGTTVVIQGTPVTLKDDVFLVMPVIDPATGQPLVNPLAPASKPGSLSSPPPNLLGNPPAR